jgi:hypothetical protein
VGPVRLPPAPGFDRIERTFYLPSPGFCMIVEQLSSVTDDVAALEPWTLTGAEVREVVVAPN